MATPPVSSATGWQRGFWCLMGTQFQNAFSDNALKQLIILVLLASAAGSAGEAEQDRMVSLVTAVFSAPFILFAMLGGWLADRNSKQRMMVYVKAAEMGIMAFAGVALALGSLPLKLCAIFLMGCHSAIFAPSKYGILPEILPHEKLSWGNGILELLTFLGVILGTVAAGIFSDFFKGSEWIAGPILVVIAFGGWLLSRQVTPVPAADPTCPVRINPVTDLWRQLRIMKQDRDLWRACWGNTGFYFISALVMMNVVVFGKTFNVTGITEIVQGLKQIEIEMDSYLLNTVMDAYSTCDHPQLAIEVFNNFHIQYNTSHIRRHTSTYIITSSNSKLIGSSYCSAFRKLILW